ncbi:transducin beta-like protein 3 [Bacillus rossius redtenbacheri]|uniref:transducin beta-like protein 3 n=1 Tax=Bacillus rossius redtenbacheri TaxID=93214 RepID=UPI002FDDB2FC
MSVKKQLKEAFEVAAQYGAFFTGGVVQWSQTGQELLCQCGAAVQVVGVAEGRVVSTLGDAPDAEHGDDEEAVVDAISTFVLSPDDSIVVASHRSGLFRLWHWREARLDKTWRSVHKGPVARLALSADAVLLASGGSDSSVRVWDLQHQACVLSLRGAQGVVSALQFHRCEGRLLVLAAADDLVIHAWDAVTGEHTLGLSGHFSTVTGLAAHPDGRRLTSCGRDKVLVVWDLGAGTKERTLPLYEGLESAVALPGTLSLPGVQQPCGALVAVAGEKGVVRVWDVQAGRQVYQQGDPREGGPAVTQLLHCPALSMLAVVTADHNVALHALPSFAAHKQLVGFSDEVLDAVFVGAGDSHIAVATNSPDIKLYDAAAMGCRLLRGHSDIVLSLAVSPAEPRLLASSAKDNSVRVWLVEEAVCCLAVGRRHTASVGCVALGWKQAGFVVSASRDCCLKLWDAPARLAPGEEQTLVVRATQRAHDKDINCVCVSPNDQLLATASQDRTAKLWAAADLSLVGVLRGHRRGVWSARFSPVDKVLLTTSADCSARLWSIEDLACIKTLEGHESSVLRGEFVTRGMQLVTAAADGLVKAWSVKTSECVCTLERHSDRVWALAVSGDGAALLTGGADSLLVLWRDVTAQRQQAEREDAQRRLLQEQQLANLVQGDQLLAALRLALSLDRPRLVLRLVQDVVRRGDAGLADSLRQLDDAQKQALLKCASVWNTNSRSCYPAQLVVSALLDEVVGGRLVAAGWLEEVLPYTQRHYDRLTQLLQDVQLLHYTAACMRPQAS